MALASNAVPNLEKLYECAQTLSNAKGLVQNRVSHNLIRKIYVLAAMLIAPISILDSVDHVFLYLHLVCC